MSPLTPASLAMVIHYVKTTKPSRLQNRPTKVFQAAETHQFTRSNGVRENCCGPGEECKGWFGVLCQRLRAHQADRRLTGLSLPN